MNFSMRRNAKLWSRLDIRQLGSLAGQNLPIRIIGFSWGRTMELVPCRISSGNQSRTNSQVIGNSR